MLGGVAEPVAVGDDGVDRPHRTHFRSQTRSYRLCSHTCKKDSVVREHVNIQNLNLLSSRAGTGAVT